MSEVQISYRFRLLVKGLSVATLYTTEDSVIVTLVKYVEWGIVDPAIPGFLIYIEKSELHSGQLLEELKRIEDISLKVMKCVYEYYFERSIDDIFMSFWSDVLIDESKDVSLLYHEIKDILTRWGISFPQFICYFQCASLSLLECNDILIKNGIIGSMSDVRKSFILSELKKYPHLKNIYRSLQMQCTYGQYEMNNYLENILNHVPYQLQKTTTYRERIMQFFKHVVAFLLRAKL